MKNILTILFILFVVSFSYSQNDNDTLAAKAKKLEIAYKQMLPLMKIDNDEFRGLTFYKTKRDTREGKAFVALYLSEKNKTNEKSIHIFLTITYSADDWLFFDEIYFKNEADSIFAFRANFETDTGNSGLIFETYNGLAPKEMLDMMPISKIRLSGKKGNYDITLNDNQKKAMKEMLIFYKIRCMMLDIPYE